MFKETHNFVTHCIGRLNDFVEPRPLVGRQHVHQTRRTEGESHHIGRFVFLLLKNRYE